MNTSILRNQLQKLKSLIGVYLITYSDFKIYVGSSTNLDKRIKEHFRFNRKLCLDNNK